MRLEQTRFIYHICACGHTYVNLNFMDIVGKNKKYYNSNILIIISGSTVPILFELITIRSLYLHYIRRVLLKFWLVVDFSRFSEIFLIKFLIENLFDIKFRIICLVAISTQSYWQINTSTLITWHRDAVRYDT